MSYQKIKKVAVTGDYNDLINKPSTVSQADLAKVATTGEYSDLKDLPLFAKVATTNSYTDLDNKPTIPVVPAISKVGLSNNYNDLDNKPALFNGDYSSLTNRPTLFSGNYSDLAGIPFTSVVKKTQTLYQSTTLTQDPELKLSLAANSVYAIQGFVVFYSGVLGGFKFGFDAPAGSTLYWQSNVSNQSNATLVSSLLDAISVTVATAGNKPININGVISTGATPGNLVFKAGQNVLNLTENTAALALSNLRLVKLS